MATFHRSVQNVELLYLRYSLCDNRRIKNGKTYWQFFIGHSDRKILTGSVLGRPDFFILRLVRISMSKVSVHRVVLLDEKIHYWGKEGLCTVILKYWYIWGLILMDSQILKIEENPFLSLSMDTSFQILTLYLRVYQKVRNKYVCSRKLTKYISVCNFMCTLKFCV